MMLIDQIDVLVHPDYHQMMVPDLPFHKIQLRRKDKWSKRIEGLKDKKAVLFYFSYLSKDQLNRGLKSLASITNRVVKDEIKRIKKGRRILGTRLILFDFLATPSEEELKSVFKSRGFIYNPAKTKIYAYGEILESCVWANSNHIKLMFDIPKLNYKLCSILSLTEKDCNEINHWRFKNCSS